MATDFKTKYQGVFYRESTKYKYNGKPDRVFYIRYRVGGRSKNERVGASSEGYSAIAASQVRANRIMTLRHGDELPNNKRLLLVDAVKRYLEDHQANKSIKEDQYRYNDLKHLDQTEVSQITISDLKKVHQSMKARGTKNATYEKVESFLNRVVRYASSINLIKEISSIRLKLPNTESKVTEIYSDEMLANYLHAITTYPIPVVADVIELIYYTGMRRSEPLKLTWDDYNPRVNTITIRDAKSGRDEIKKLSTHSKEIIERQRGRSHTYIFELEPRKPIRANRISYHSRRIADVSGLPQNFRPLHSLRHNVGTQLAMKGAPASLIQSFLNHKNIETTQRYIDIAEDSLQGAADMLEAHLNIEPKQKKNLYNVERIEVENK